MKTLIVMIVAVCMCACATVPPNEESKSTGSTGLWIAAGIVVGALILSSDDGSSAAGRGCHIVITGGDSETVCP